MSILFRVNSKAKTLNGVIRAIERNTDFLVGCFDSEKLDVVGSGLDDGTIIANGREIIAYCC